MIRNSFGEDATGFAGYRNVSRRIYTRYTTQPRRCYLPRSTRVVGIIIMLRLIEDAV